MANLVHTELEFFILCISTLIPLVNPLGVMPIFLTMTEGYIPAQRIAIARKAVITGTTALIIFALLGSLIFSFFGITIEAFQIMGGIIFFRSGLNALEAKVGRTRTTEKEQQEFEDAEEIAFTPIGIPLITGPGAITGAMLLASDTPSEFSFGTLILAVFIVMFFMYLILVGGEKLGQKIGVARMRVIQRIMGLMLMVIAVQFIINGVTSVLKEI